MAARTKPQRVHEKLVVPKSNYETVLELAKRIMGKRQIRKYYSCSDKFI